MNSNSIESCAKDLAHEISNRSRFNLEEIQTLISVSFKNQLLNFIKEHSTQEEREYQLLLDLIKLHKLGSPEYNKLGYKLSSIKAKKVITNRILDTMKREEGVKALKTFVKEKFGEDALSGYQTGKENLS